MSKETELLALAKKRQSYVYDNYLNIVDVHDGIYECDFVSPRSKSAHNINSGILLVLQDWIDEASLNKLDTCKRQKLKEVGFAEWMPTNKRIIHALDHYINKSQSDIYITNLFPYIKKSTEQKEGIGDEDYYRAGREFLDPLINIIKPKLLICGGRKAAIEVCNGLGIDGSITPKFCEGIPHQLNDMVIISVQHPGYRYHSFQSWNAVAEAWKTLNN